MKKIRSGFTLIELLTVIAIIGILGAILLVGMDQILVKSNTAKSASNLRQLGQGVFLYINENGSYPPGYNNSKGDNGVVINTWQSQIAEYYPETKLSDELLLHPGDELGGTRTYSMVRGRKVGSDFVGVGISVGSSDDAPEETTEIATGRPVAEVIKPMDTILLTEYPAPENKNEGIAYAVVDSPSEQTANQPHLNGKSGSFNYLFCDGHVELLHPNETIGTGSLSAPNGFWTLDPID